MCSHLTDAYTLFYMEQITQFARFFACGERKYIIVDMSNEIKSKKYTM